MKRKIELLLAFLLLSISCAFAQKLTVKGTVLDETGQTIIGATIREKGVEANGTATDMDGRFTLTVNQGATILVSYVGYKTQEVKAAAQLTIKMVPDSEMLDEVVVTALGLERQKRDLGYATTKIDANDLTKAKSVDVAGSLQGKVAGLNIQGMNGGVMGDVKITMRGIRSLTGNNNPMLLLDGVPVALDFLSSINPNDVKNINVLKGTSAAAIYGPDARNGVIVVTTKAGEYQDKPSVTISSSVQASTISFFPKFQSSFGSGEGSNFEFMPYTNESWGPAYDGQERQVGKPDAEGNVKTAIYSPNKNVHRDFFDTGLTIQNDVSLSAKDFYLSVQDAQITGVVPGDKNHRFSLRGNASKQLFKTLRASVNLNYIQHNWDIFSNARMGDHFSEIDMGMHEGIMDLVFATPMWVPLADYKIDTHWGDYNNYFNEYSLNPYQALDLWRANGRRHEFLGNIEFNYSPFSWLKFNYRAAVNVQSEVSKGTSKELIASSYGKSRGFKDVSRAVSDQSYQYYRLTSEPFLTADYQWDDFKIGGIFGSYYRDQRQVWLGASASPLQIEDLYNVSGRVGEATPTDRLMDYRMLSFYGSLSFGYKGWLNLELTGRNDKVSVLSPENNSFFYPGVNASVVMTDAIPGLQSDYLTFLKLRASYNKTGNSYLSAYQLIRRYHQTEGFPLDGVPGYEPYKYTVDPNLKPEFINSLELGFETSLFKDRATLDFSWYDQRNTNQVIDVATSKGYGASTATVNAASFRNYGLELSLKLTPLISYAGVDLDFTLNYSYNNSKILSLYEGMNEMVLSGYYMARAIAVVDKPAFIYSTKDYNRTPDGKVIVDKFTGNPSPEAGNTNYGRTMPLHILSLAPSISWKGLTVSTLFEYKGGHYSFNIQGRTMAWDGQSMITAANGRERFVFPNSVYDDNQGKTDAQGNPLEPKYVDNENVTVQSFYDFFHGDNYQAVGTNMLFSADTWRWRELTVSYSLPEKWLSRQSVLKGVDISLVGRNLMLWTPRTNQWSDPDFSVYGGNEAGSITASVYPPSRTWGGSITLRL